ncbi:MAG: tyrosyl-tRNA synthetase [Acidimicrobiales bacterium]|jgi:tyrosyl-tRNA synthetase
MKLSEELVERGFVYQFSTEDLSEILDGGKRTVYLGIDPTADAIHVGNLVPYMLLNHLMKDGHKVILLMGGGTALIGDPSGKDSERDFVSVDIVQDRCAKMEVNVRKIASPEIMFANNYDWLSKLSMVEFLRDVGKHFTVNAMMKKDSVSARLASEQGISFTEFSYALLQSYDYYHLHKEYGCDLQIGGSDQWGNIISGVDYVRRTTGDTVHALTMPLVVDKATGKKFGKSEGNAIWLDSEKTSPYVFYQFWLNTTDESVVDYLKLFTSLSLEEITDIGKTFADNPGARSAQKKLAYEVTTFIHGTSVADLAKEVSDILFGEGNISDMSESGKQTLLENAPAIKISIGTSVVDILVKSELATSNREARTFIEGGAVTIDGRKISDVEEVITPESVANGLALLKRGKKQLCVLEVE